MSRQILFVGHANPQDNVKASWLSLQLARMGYRVWCDLTGLLGGKPIWRTIDELIRHHTAKYIFVLTRDSNSADGCEKELQQADNVRKLSGDSAFIIPCRFDNIHYTELNSYIVREKYYDFEPNWGAGLNELRRALTDYNIPKTENDGPDSVTYWWNHCFEYASSKTLVAKSEQYITNCFPVTHIPPELFVHEVDADDKFDRCSSSFPYPHVKRGSRILTFASVDQMTASDNSYKIQDSRTVVWRLKDVQQMWRSQTRIDLQNVIIDIMRQAWESVARARGLVPHLMSGNVNAYSFVTGTRPLRVSVPGVQKSPKVVVGIYHEKYSWHLAFRMKPFVRPRPFYAVTVHILFSNDGMHIWDSSAALLRARRSFCRSWFNKQWRDLVLTAMQWLSGNKDSLIVPLGQEENLRVSTIPFTVQSERSYLYGSDFEKRIDEKRVDDEFEEEDEV